MIQMPEAIAVSFRRGGKPQYYQPRGRNYGRGQWVVVETARGLELGQVVGESADVPEGDRKSPLRPVLRSATPHDRARDTANRRKEAEALEFCERKVREHQLPMRLIDAVYSLDGKRLTIYFSSETRVDFRALVRDLAPHFKTRIELHQLGVRDVARVVGGYGTCGQQLCCRAWMPEFYPTAIKMAKEQGLSLNPAKVSGLCGRLLCCLRYEYDTYVYLRKGAPKQGKAVETERGPARIKDLSLLKGEALLEFPDGRTEWRAYDSFVRTMPTVAATADTAAGQELEKEAQVEQPMEPAPTVDVSGRRKPSDRIAGRRRTRGKGRRTGKASAAGEHGAPDRGTAASQAVGGRQGRRPGGAEPAESQPQPKSPTTPAPGRPKRRRRRASKGKSTKGEG